MELYVPFFKYPKHLEFQNIVDWEIITPNYEVKTGDILLFSGSGFLSSGIKLFTASIWSHVGIACWVKLYKDDGSSEKDLFCFELGSNNYTDLISGKILDKGVRLVRLGDIAVMYDIISVRRLKFERKLSFPNEFKNFMLEWNGVPFPDLLNLINATMIDGGYRTRKRKVTCAHLVAVYMDYFHIHRLNFDPSQLMPEHYSGNSRAFPEDIFEDDEEMTIYKDSHWARMRIFYAIIFVIIIIILALIKIKKSQK